MATALDQLLAQTRNQQVTRRGLLKGSVAAGAGALALTVVGGGLNGRPTASVGAATMQLGSDLEILNYALVLEYLEADAYALVNGAGILSGRAATYFQAFGAHEAAHRDAIIATIRQLGGTPVAKPQFNFSSVPREPDAVVAFFQQVEAVGISAYLGAAPSITSPEILEAALSIHAVEAEHTAALADLVAPGTDLFAPSAFEQPRTPAEVLAIVAPFLAPAQPGATPAATATATPRPATPAATATPTPMMPGLPNTGGGFGAGRVSDGGGTLVP